MIKRTKNAACSDNTNAIFSLDFQLKLINPQTIIKAKIEDTKNRFSLVSALVELTKYNSTGMYRKSGGRNTLRNRF